MLDLYNIACIATAQKGVDSQSLNLIVCTVLNQWDLGRWFYCSNSSLLEMKEIAKFRRIYPCSLVLG